MALTDAIAVLLKKKDHLLRDDRILCYDTFTYGPFATADGTGNKAEWVMPYAGEVVEVLYGAESDTVDGQFNVENDGSDIFSAEKTDWGAGVFNAEPDQNKTFVRGAKLRVDVSNAGTAVVNGAVTVVVAFYKHTKK